MSEGESMEDVEKIYFFLLHPFCHTASFFHLLTHATKNSNQLEREPGWVEVEEKW